MWCLEAVYNRWYSHPLCFTQMHTRSNHRRDPLAALRCHIIWFTILGSIVTVQNISSGLSMLIGHLGMKCIRRYCKSDIVDAFHQQKGTLLAMPYRISTLQMPYYINSKYI